MSYQENINELQNENTFTLANTVSVKTKPKLGSDSEDTGEDYYIEINLPSALATVLNGSGLEWTLSEIYTSSSIQEMVVLDGDVQSQSFNQTDLNMATYSNPKRVEIYTETDSSASPYLVFQEVVSNGIQGWQIYAPVPFNITYTTGGKNTWTTATSTELVSVQQVKVYDNCISNIQNPPPPGSVAMFDMTAQNIIGEVDLQS
ncbi:MAG TPA: hypothetical protein PKY59_11100 [Pyrinomonadaceae bacterium]|nr:hypothetical protein [Pyrinomonadaceae bacterium]